MKPSRYYRAAVGIVALAACTPRNSFAQSQGTELALAEALYRQGRQLMTDKRYVEACSKFAESYRLDAATGTMLNLAACHEADGKLATAWIEYTRAVGLARRDQREDRVRFAQERIAVLEPKLSHLTIAVSGEADLPNLEVRVDDAVVRSVAREVPAPVDAGMHEVTAKAPGHRPWRIAVMVGVEASDRTVNVPRLELEADVVAKPAARPTEPLPTAEPAAPSVSRLPLILSATTAVALAGGALATGALYQSEKGKYDDGMGESHYDHAKTLGALNAGLWIGALGAAGLTTYFVLQRAGTASTSSSSTATTVSPWMGPGGAGLSVGGTL